eukprot:Transcript_18800.p1 GENE.Transcript_18800~~Transcript_18800.p1  ORF type:complete len:310 (+),score=82.90 Transcript_18800:76-930(+)
MLAILSTTLLSWQPGVSAPCGAVSAGLSRGTATVARKPHVAMCDDSSAAEGLPMDLLARRIQQMSEELSTARLFILDAMVPGQRLSFAAPAAMVETLRSSDQVVMFGVDPRQRSLCTHGVSVMLDEVEERDDGDFDVVLTAGRMCALADLGEDEGSRWKGRGAQVRWVSLDAPDETEDAALLERSAALEKLVDEWASLVRAGRERTPGQLDGVIRDLGPMPDADAPSARALWIAGLINPLPALGVALEIRPAALQAPTAEVRLKVVEMGIQDSIERLKSPGPAF